jgi:thiamine-phosphate pyrophosphorylase
MVEEALRVPLLHVVTDDDVLRRPGFTVTAAGLMEAGGARVALHVRGPNTDGGTLYRLAHALAGASFGSGALLVVNDRVDVALTAGAGAVQLGRRSLPPRDARRILGPEALLGVSTHNDAEVAQAAAEGAHWIFVGTIYATPSHPDVRPRGPEAVASARRAAGDVPVVAIGGLTPERTPEVCAAGAYGVAAIRGIWDASDPGEAVRRFVAALVGTPDRRKGEA